MNDQLKPPRGLGPIAAATISVVIVGLLSLAAGAKVNDLAAPTLGPIGASVAGTGTAVAAFVFLVVVSYRGLTR